MSCREIIEAAEVSGMLTGSQAYGTPHAGSDIDLALLVSPAVLALLSRMADDTLGSGSEGRSVSLRFGRLNLVLHSDPVEHGAWMRATRDLLRRPGAVSRDEAIDAVKLALLLHGR